MLRSSGAAAGAALTQFLTVVMTFKDAATTSSSSTKQLTGGFLQPQTDEDSSKPCGVCASVLRPTLMPIKEDDGRAFFFFITSNDEAVRKVLWQH